MSVNIQKDSINTTWGLDNVALDDWPETDSKQFSLLQYRKSTSSSTSHHHKHDIHNNNDNAKKCSLQNLLANDPEVKQEKKDVDKPLISIITVYSLLNSIRQNEQSAKESQHHKRRLLYVTPPPPPPPSPVSISGSNCNSDENSRIVFRKKRGNQRPPADVAVKRQRNTDAARRSRMRKAVKMETLEARVGVLKTDNERFRVKISVLENEVICAAEKEQRNRQRVLALEAQLAMAHRQFIAEQDT